MSRGKRRKLTLEALDCLIGELEGVYSILPSAYYELDDNDDDDDEPVAGKGTIESEEVEVALSAVVETVSNMCNLASEPKSLNDLFEVLFSSTDNLVDLAVNLEDAVNGYFGELFGDCLDQANAYLSDIIEILKERRKKWSR